jgi:hypothetical protein
MLLIKVGTRFGGVSHEGSIQLGNLDTAGRTFLGEVLGCMRRPFSEEDSSLPDILRQVIPESAEHDGSEPASHTSASSVPALALDKLANQEKGAPMNEELPSLESKPDTEADAPHPLSVGSPEAETLTSEQVAALEGEALQILCPLHT